jgi:hypothetical protein
MQGTNSTAELAERITALGPWFHNICLGGVYTAPRHFLGDYPRVKYRHFSSAIPADLRGKRVLDPKLHFVEHRYSHDPTNWWVPNRACVEAMLRSSGFAIESQPEAEVYLCRWQPLTVDPDGTHSVYPGRAAVRP